VSLCECVDAAAMPCEATMLTFLRASVDDAAEAVRPVMALAACAGVPAAEGVTVGWGGDMAGDVTDPELGRGPAALRAVHG